MRTRDASKLIEYALDLERRNKTLLSIVEQERKENARLRDLRHRAKAEAERYRKASEGAA